MGGTKNLKFTRSFFLKYSDFDCLQDLFQNFADEAFAVNLGLKMFQWLEVGMTDWNLNEPQAFEIEDIASIKIVPKLDGSFEVYLRNEDVSLYYEDIMTMGFSTKRHSNVTVGCKGVGLKNAMGAWSARHGTESRFPLIGQTCNVKWYPQYTPTGEFTVHERTQEASITFFEWKIKHVRRSDLLSLFDSVLWLKPPTSKEVIFSNDQGQIFGLDSRHASRVYIYHSYICDYDMACGINLFPKTKTSIRLTDDRKNIVREDQQALVQHITELWKAAIESKPELISTLFDLVCSNGCEAELAKSFPESLLIEFKKRYGDNTYPVTEMSESEARRWLGQSFKVVRVHPILAMVLADHIGSPQTMAENWMRGSTSVERVSIENVVLRDWEELMRLCGIAYWDLVDVPSDYPFLVHRSEDDIVFNATFFTRKHEDICDDPDCTSPCVFHQLVELLVKSHPKVPLRCILNHIEKKEFLLANDVSQHISIESNVEEEGVEELGEESEDAFSEDWQSTDSESQPSTDEDNKKRKLSNILDEELGSLKKRVLKRCL